MVKDVYFGNTLRKSFARKQEITEMPGLLDIQKKSYRWFLETGLREVFKDVGSISDYAGNLELSFIDFSMKESPKYNVETCKARDATYAAPIKVKVRLRNKETEEIKEQEIFMGDFPLMTEGATFVINGAERVIVSQIVRSPGMYYNMKRTRLATSLIPPPSSLIVVLGWNTRRIALTCSGCVSTRTARSPSPVSCAPSGSRPMRRSRMCSGRAP